MKLDGIKAISVLGAGIMGHGIAQSFIMGGYPVTLLDIQESILETAKAHIKNNFELFGRAGLIQSAESKRALGRLVTTTELKRAVQKGDFIVEAVPEDLELKQALFQEVESFCPAGAIIASNTSSLTLKDIGARVNKKERLVITHWFNPPHIVPTVEVVKGDRTSDETLEVAYQLLSKIKKAPVKLKFELPGFLINRIQIAMVREVFDLYEKGIASAADIDKAVKGSFGFRLASIGPLLTADLGGLDTWLRVSENLLPKIQSSVEAPGALQRLVSQGHTGIKSGKGFYDYAGDFSNKELDGVIENRDREFLQRLKALYWEKKSTE
jgi:3-hydroxybutyryl-CoA dehydrogenase